MPGNGGNKGSIVIGTKTINFDGLAPVDVANLGSFTINPAGVADVLSVASGANLTTVIVSPIGSQAALVVSGSTGGTAIETIALWNIGTLTIDTAVTGPQDGIDAITIPVGGANGTAASITNLTITTGTVGADTVAINGAVTLPGSLTVNTADVSSTAAGTISVATGVSITNTGTSSALAGAISGSSATLTKNGAGTLMLSGTNTYGGTSTVNAGTLLVNGSNTGAGAVDVNNSAIFGGADNDTLNGGNGYDNLYGGLGIDTFVISPAGVKEDTVFDFVTGFGGDVVQVTGYGAITYVASAGTPSLVGTPGQVTGYQAGTDVLLVLPDS